MSTTRNPTVVIVGAGPVGLIAGCDLARRGISIRIIDKLTAPTTESRAIAIHARSCDMLDRMGILDDLIATGVKSTAMNMFANKKKMFRAPLDTVDSQFAYTLITAQTETERVLTEHLNGLGVSIDRGLTLTGLTQDDDTVHITLQHADGTTEHVDTSWVIGTDGAHSSVRQLVGTKLQGSFTGERFILGDVEVEPAFDNTNMYTYFDSDGPVVTLPMRGGRVRFLAQTHDTPDTPLNQHPTTAQLQKIIDDRIGGVTITTPHWITCFEIHHGQVPEYRHGRVFLAGDAAHIHSPAGGQGMNTGMQDAFNLCWKLAEVIKGDAGAALLDSYNAERHPVGKRVIDFTSTLTKVGTLTGLARMARNALVKVVGHVPPAVRVLASNITETNIAYKDSPVVLAATPRHTKVTPGQHVPHIGDAELQKQISAAWAPEHSGHTVLTVTANQPVPAAGPAGQMQVLITADGAPVGGYDIVVADPKGLVAKRCGLSDGCRLVVRPDGYLGAITALNDRTGVADYFAQIAR